MYDQELIVTNKNGAEIDCTNIADVYTFGEAMTERDYSIRNPENPLERLNAGKAVLTLWSQAHAMKDEILRLRAALDTTAPE